MDTASGEKLCRDLEMWKITSLECSLYGEKLCRDLEMWKITSLEFIRCLVIDLGHFTVVDKFKFYLQHYTIIH